jgi:uncharacterized protein (TIGR02001 family)
MKAKLGLLGSVAALAVAGSIAATPAAAGDWFKRESAGSIKDAPVADTGRKLEWSVNGGLMSDYVFRGFSQNDEDPAWFVGADVTYGIAYAGIWAAQVDQFFTASDAEYDIYGGITPKLGPVAFDFGVIYYGYANQDKSFVTGSGGVKVDYWEFKAGASTEINKFSMGVTYYYSPEYTFETGVAHTVEGTLGYSLPKVWIFDPSIDGTIGYNDVELAGDYTYWNAGLSLAVEKLTLDFRYWDTDIDNDGAGTNGKNIADERFVFTATVALP